ncbi:hypothetical protein [Curtobacterium sp. MCSS17_015]|uniref:hypothetical protein n=1 Tax=Curtobacterium sp. MCSS17_015 TaxID=2175666 RepID=UPI000DA9036B|nr:hypothetical protein [Curtobacterium sp. MCSS17_015]WIB25851.1 hypothetical protein DEJ18_12445 [Curtobacterium sp. MCSS17_015]
MDITQALAPNSDQLDAVELVEPRTFTIDAGSRLGRRDGKIVAEIQLVELDRVWRPSKGMLDVLAACWGTKGTEWVGRRVTVYNDPEVMFGKEKRGGVRISHLSHIDGPRDVTIRASGAGRKQLWHVEPLPTAAAQPDWLSELAIAGNDPAALNALGHAAKNAGAGEDVLGQIRAALNAAKEQNA